MVQQIGFRAGHVPQQTIATRFDRRAFNRLALGLGLSAATPLGMIPMTVVVPATGKRR